MFHLQCVSVLIDRTCTYVNEKPQTLQVLLEQWDAQVPLNGYFQKLLARQGNQVLDNRLKSYQLHSFLSPCNHSIQSSLLSLANTSLYLTLLCLQRSSARTCSRFLNHPASLPPSLRSDPKLLEAQRASLYFIIPANFYLLCLFLYLFVLPSSVVEEVLTQFTWSNKISRCYNTCESDKSWI